MGSNGSLGRAELSSRQLAPERQALDVQQLLWEVPKADNERLGLDPDPAAPQGVELQLVVGWPWRETVKLLDIRKC